jgi:pilus assembly protein CpaE
MAQNIGRRILIVQDGPTLAQLSHALVAEGCEIISAESEHEAAQRLEQYAPEVVLIEAELPGFDGFAFCRRIRQSEATHDLPVLMLAFKSELPDKMAGFEAGADEYITKPFQMPELIYRLKIILARKPRFTEFKPETPGNGKIIALFGTKGGVGRTTIAVNLALALLQRTRSKVMLFDADFFFGDLALHLNLPPSHTILDFVEHINQLDNDLADQILIPHPSGLRVLISPRSPEKVEYITSAHVDRLLKFLANHFDYIVVDCQGNYDERMLVVLEQADTILLITKPEVGCIKNMAVFSELAIKLGFPFDKIHIVLNRSGSNSGIDPKEIERIFRRQIAFHIGSGGRAIVVSVNRGVPLILEQPNHPFSLQVKQIAEFLTRSLIKMPI